MLWPSELLVDGVAVPLAGVLSDLTIRHGREDVNADPTASTMQATLLGLSHAQTKAFKVNAAVVLNARDGAGPVQARFTGRVTDAGLDVDELTLIAVGQLATLSRYEIGLTNWPEETWSARVTRCFVEAGLARANMITNPSFETNTTGWTANGSATIAQDTTDAHDGTKCLRLTTTAANVVARASAALTAPVFTVGTRYRISIWVKPSASLIGKKFGLQLYEQGGAAAATSTIFAEPVLVEGWQKLEAFGLVKNTGRTSLTAFLGGITGNGWPSGATFLLDDVQASPSELELYPDPGFDPVLVARDAATAGETTLGDYLAFLAPMVGAAVCDRPDGRILVQAIGSRALASAFTLDPATVEYAPAWSQELPLGNAVTVRYTGDQSEQVTVKDTASIAAYGNEFPATIDTTFKLLADADTRARARLARSAYAHWNMPSAPVVVPLTLSIGTPVQLASMPAAAPYDPWTPILEGWTDEIRGEEWTMQLALSDPLASALTLPWNAVPATAAYQWDTINQTVTWADALTLEELAA